MIDRLFTFLLLCLVLSIPLGVAAVFTGQVLLNFVFFWPLLMSGMWMAGGIYFWFYWERHWPWGENVAPPELPGNPLVSIIIPCYNEGVNVRETIAAAMAQRYTNIEVITVNDGSSDNTGEELDRLTQVHDRLRVVHLARNQGKAVALKAGALASRSDLLVCIDGDAMLDKDAVAYMVAPMIEQPRVGAVTGNPRIRTRSTLVGRVQVGEFSSIIGLIKRTQRVYGRVFTVSGVLAAFRKRALADVGYWSPDMATEDIDISWKLQLNHWSVFYEPRAIAWILMPETLRGLWKQRLRWAQGGAEVFVKNIRSIWGWRTRRMWPLILEFCLSTIWAFAFMISIILFFIGLVFPLPENLQILHIFPPHFTGLLLGIMCLLQVFVSLLIDRRYEDGLLRSMFWVIWYPVVYWILSLFTTLVAFTLVMLRQRQERARWVSPDRGIEREGVTS